MKNIRVQDQTNPVTGETYQNVLFDTQLLSINRKWVGETPNGKKFNLCTISTPQGVMTARIPLSVEAQVNSEVTISATKIDLKAGGQATNFQVIGIPNGTGADASFFDTLLTQASPIVAGSTTVAKEEF